MTQPSTTSFTAAAAAAAAAGAPADHELDEQALDAVGGGITVKKLTDATSADLFLKSADGKH